MPQSFDEAVRGEVAHGGVDRDGVVRDGVVRGGEVVHVVEVVHAVVGVVRDDEGRDQGPSECDAHEDQSDASIHDVRFHCSFARVGAASEVAGVDHAL